MNEENLDIIIMKIKQELSEINKEYREKDPVRRDTVFTVTHRIEKFLNYGLNNKIKKL